MKTTILILSMLFITLTSCDSSEPENDEEYYKIAGADFDYIPTSYENLGTIISFKNQHNHVVRFETHAYNSYKEIGGPGWITGYYYDHMFVTLVLLDMEIAGEDDHRCQSFQVEIIKQKEGDMLQRVHIPSSPSINFCTGNIKEYYAPEVTNYNVGTMSVNNIVYDKVLVFEVSGGNIDYYTLFNNSTIHTVYYDMKQGIIGFDDTINDLQYRLVN